ncbi:NAD(P)(+) transhydrogenase (Re/Si-specific) subunit alpha [Halorhodospira abdelmalekii]|uniref:Re/Si-specific NAD(P)(+) transhydrogenase subunit alpha n=1 Tax=Halorhodospira abdelmalekii TaxID=421629 RepID=UPI001907C69A|nr:Re/Si-specific NAD(P)(+) transhydrogenase subunit alpha [Halorhodospira abdelmalekii]MBK1735935.1 NAD(P)(+) transhydrogenase (Re/Si-specific) subunit alpha [Halorhodospira abdelmalekii]
MAIKVAVPKETRPGERRVALVPGALKQFGKLGVELLLEKGAGADAGFDDAEYAEGGVEIVSRTELFRQADVLLTVQPPTPKDVSQLRQNKVIVGFMAPHEGDERIQTLCQRKATSFAMELVPRITRAQSIDALSSQAAAAGYKAALIAAERSPRFFPMLTTAAGTIRPARVVIVGAGVAGLQAIATCRRLGAQVQAYDVRPETKEQVESLGAKFIDTGVEAVGEGGYARELTAKERKQQEEALAEQVTKAHVVITTAAVPGRAAPRIIGKTTVERMQRGAVIVDMAAETGGNCAVTRSGKEITHKGVAVIGPENLPAGLPVHASEMYCKNLYNLLSLMITDGALELDWDDQVIADTCLTHAGEVRHGPTRERLEGGDS